MSWGQTKHMFGNAGRSARVSSWVAMLGGAVVVSMMLLAAPASATAAASIVKGALPPPDKVVSAADLAHGYQIGVGDSLQVDVFNVESLSRTVQVDATGRIDYPLIGAVTARGKTAPQLADEISARLAESYLQSPRVTVFVKETPVQKYTVEGAVREPGVFNWDDQMTLMQAIAKAKGVESTASLNDVLVFRVVNHQKVAGMFNLEDIRRGRVDDPLIYSSDLIVVSNSKSQKMWRQFLSTTPLLFLLPK